MRNRLALILLGLFVMAGPALGYEVASVTDGGSVKGFVKFAGTLPKLPPVPVKKNQDVCGSSKPAEALVVGPNQGVRSAVVMVEGVLKGKKAEKEVIIDNAKCVFTPHVAAVMAGGKIKIKNSDDILHNTHGFLKRATIFNVALPRQHQEIDITQKLRRTGVVEILCDAHTHMRAWLLVHDNPYVAVTDENGNFTIDEIPAGKYKITMWHESWTEKGRDKDGRVVYDDPRVMAKEITVPPKGAATVEFELK